MGFLDNAATALVAKDAKEPVLVFTSDSSTVPSSLKTAFKAGYKLKTATYDSNLKKMCWVVVLPEYSA